MKNLLRDIRRTAAYAWLQVEGAEYSDTLARNTALSAAENYLSIIEMANSQLDDPIEPYERTDKIWLKKPIIKNLEKIISDGNSLNG